VLENQNAALEAVRELGIKTVNIGAKDLIEKKVHIVLGLMWQTMREELKRDVSIESHPEMAKYLEETKSSPGSTTSQPKEDLTLEKTLLLWCNALLNRASSFPGEYDSVKNFDVDLMDSRAFTVVLNQIAPKICTLTPLEEEDLDKRAELMLNEADKIECKSYITADHIAHGNSKLNITFMTSLFNKHAELEKQYAEDEKSGLLSQPTPQPQLEAPIVENKPEPEVVQTHVATPVVEKVTTEPESKVPVAEGGLSMQLIMILVGVLVLLLAVAWMKMG